MASFNKITLIGNVGNDPISKVVEDKKVAEFNVAINDPIRKEEKPTWYRISVWGPRAEVIMNYVRKGQPIHVEGRLNVRNYLDNEGKERYSLEVVASDFTLLGSRESSGNMPESKPAERTENKVAQPVPNTIDKSFTTPKYEVNDADDLPF